MKNFLILVTIYASLLTHTARADDFPEGSVGHDLQTEYRFDKARLTLYLVGNYMAAHKYFGVDYRYLAGDITEDDQVFYRQFPSRPLRELHTNLARQCRRSVEYCVRAIYDVAKDSGTLRRFFKPKDDATEVPIFEPFDNAYDMFIFRQTAAYYMCSHAVSWKKLEDERSYLQYAGKPGCLDKLVWVNEVPADKRPGILLSFSSHDHVVIDRRDEPGRNVYNDGVTCALLWFCPDPCYGRKSQGNVLKTVMDSEDMGNKCRNLLDPECRWDWEANGNFDDLIRNKFNITCNCASDRKGFVWSNQYDLCVDKDECHDQTVTCQGDKVCRNTVGSYKCTCPNGFRDNSTSGRCEQMSVISGNMAGYSVVGRPMTMAVTHEEDLLSDMMAFVGFSSGSSVRPCYAFIVGLLVIFTMS